MPGSRRWLYVTENYQRLDPNNHGSCVTSLVAGPTFGVAKNANIVLVNVDSSSSSGVVLEAFVKIKNDVIANGLQGKAVVNLSFGCK